MAAPALSISIWRAARSVIVRLLCVALVISTFGDLRAHAVLVTHDHGPHDHGPHAGAGLQHCSHASSQSASPQHETSQGDESGNATASSMTLGAGNDLSADAGVHDSDSSGSGSKDQGHNHEVDCGHCGCSILASNTAVVSAAVCGAIVMNVAEDQLHSSVCSKLKRPPKSIL